MKMSPLSGNGALKLLLLLTSLSHHYSGLVTGADPAKGICADLAANKSVDFFLVGANSHGRLLITAKPDYLVYELRNDSLYNDTLNIYGVTPIPLNDYYPGLYENKNLLYQLFFSNGSLPAFTMGNGKAGKTTVYLKILSRDPKQLFSYNMDIDKVDMITNYDPSILDTQQFVSPFTDLDSAQDDVYSFVYQPHDGPRRVLYDLILYPNMSPATSDTTCKVEYGRDTMVLRYGQMNCHDCNRFYNDWNWTESPRGWADITHYTFNIRFYLFDRQQQQVYFFDQSDQDIPRNDVFSVVYQKSYKDFFRCTPTPTTQPSTTTKVSSQATTSPTTSFQPVNSTTSSPPVTITPSVTTDDIHRTSTEKPKIALWIIILIVVILFVIFITVAFFVGYKLGSSNKSSDTKPDKVASTNAASSAKQAQGNSNQLAVGSTGPTGSKLNAKSSAASKASTRSSVVAPSKGPEAKVQGLKAKK